jgi:FkbM family methyltransferase
MKSMVKKFLRTLGFELIRCRPHVVTLLCSWAIDVVIDVGANDGQYGDYIRSEGYVAKIVSFEPIAEPYRKLKAKTDRDPVWEAIPIGLGRESKTETINVSRSSVFSSILQPLPVLTDFANNAADTIGHQHLSLSTLDSEFKKLVRTGERAFLKIDTQGYEMEVLLGACASLSNIFGIQVELSLRPLYKGEASLVEVVTFLEQKGFRMVLIEPVSYDQSRGTLLQIDCVFLNGKLEAGNT